MSNSEFLFTSLFGWFLMLGLPLILALIIIKFLRKRDIKRQARFELEVEKEKERLLNEEDNDEFSLFFYFFMLY